MIENPCLDVPGRKLGSMATYYRWGISWGEIIYCNDTITIDPSASVPGSSSAGISPTRRLTFVVP